jgi:hypothetical protein
VVHFKTEFSALQSYQVPKPDPKPDPDYERTVMDGSGLANAAWAALNQALLEQLKGLPMNCLHLLLVVISLLLQPIACLVVGGIANMAAVTAGQRGPLVRFGRPVCKRLFGTNKTWRGLAVGLVVGLLLALPQLMAGSLGAHFAYGWWLWPLVALATMVGDILTSGWKRLRHVGEGRRHWTDPLDPVGGLIVGLAVMGGWSWPVILTVAVLACLLLRRVHPLISKTGHQYGCKVVPF